MDTQGRRLDEKGTQAGLVFPEASTKVGRPYAVAEHDDAPATVAVRELIQNALDAYAEINKDRSGICRVTFKTGRLKTSDIPDFEEGYKGALDAALRSWRGAENASVINYLKSMKDCADQDEIDVLYVIDNGKGLDTAGMDAMLGEGTPKKQNGSSGSFGVGHLTAYGLSGLNYIFYGGKQQDGQILGAGHAILAGFADSEGKLKSNNGYFVKEFSGLFDSLFTYCDSKNLPEFLLSELRKIQGSGSVIAILGFNWFKKDLEGLEEKNKKVNELILEAAAKNFAIAICAQNLEVFTTERIDVSRIVGFLEDRKNRNQDKDANLTLEAIKTYQEATLRGNLENDKFADCDLAQRNGTTQHNVLVWRNGMLIIKKHRGLSREMFGSKKLLNALVMLSGSKNPRGAHDLVKNAETPMHDRIQESRLSSKQERANLKALLNDIREWIKERAEETGDESSDLSDEILVSSGSTMQPKPYRYLRKLVDDDDDDAGDHGDEGGGGRKGHGRKGEGVRGKRAVPRKNIVEAKVQGKARPDGTYLIKLVPNKDIGKAVIQVTVNNGVDSSCLGDIKERELKITGATASDGKNCQIVNGDVELEGVEKDKPINIMVTFDAPKEIVNDVSLGCLLGSVERA